jgi:hypothetical protein
VQLLPRLDANATGSKTAEGTTDVLEKAAGRTHLTLSTLKLPDTPTMWPWWLDMIITRETTLATDLYTATGLEQTGEEYEPERNRSVPGPYAGVRSRDAHRGFRHRFGLLQCDIDHHLARQPVGSSWLDVPGTTRIPWGRQRDFRGACRRGNPPTMFNN